ncbi:hypothetical protein [Paludifilum halophilum]|uniref:Uncharacterized protein n=1 Tax=Paludifilum halophilum TaxID=1642702 RepID=A0A235BA50_9BACL|nr:hypothetical protein [Paludifilum halophilum]OYD09146.1 hypothetical protein CHM34_05130 [Paludifilum halophilum]
MTDHQRDPEKDTPSKTETLYTLEEASRQLQVETEALHRLFRGDERGKTEKEGTFWIREGKLATARSMLESRENGKPVPLSREVAVYQRNEDRKENASGKEGDRRWKTAFESFVRRFRRLKPPLNRKKVQEWVEAFFRIIEQKKRKEVKEEFENRQVSLKLGFMTGQNELYCDFCEVNDHFYPGAIFADVYVDGTLQWMMCPNCLNYCREQSHGSMEQNIRARFNQLAFRLEREARRARRLAASEDFRVPGIHEWEAWETASFAMREVAASYGQNTNGFGHERTSTAEEPGPEDPDFDDMRQ